MFQSNEGLCTESDASKHVCHGLVYAAAQTDTDSDGTCGGSVGGCERWLTIKNAVAIMWQAEVGDIVNDAIALVLGALLGFSKFGFGGRRVLWYTTIALFLTFVVDLVLEGIIIHYVGSVSEPLSTLKDSFCFPVGDGYATFVKLQDMSATIQLLASVNIAGAGVGGLCDVAQASVDAGSASDESSAAARRKTVSHVTTILTLVAALGELFLGVASFVGNTQPFLDEVKNIEAAVLAHESEVQACYVRNPQLPAVRPAGFQWEASYFIFAPIILQCVALLIGLGFCCAHKGSVHDPPS